MVTSKDGEQQQGPKQKKSNFVSAATLKRQQEQAAAVQAHRGNHGGGHAPKKGHGRELNSGSEGGWGVSPGYLSPPSHSAKGGPMDSARST